MNITEVVSKELLAKYKIAPLKDGETREFVLCNAGVWDPSANRLTSPQGWGTPGQCMIKDEFDKKNPLKLILNVVGYTPVKGENGVTYMNPEIAYLKFGSTGRKICTHENNAEYLFMKLHNKNRDNKNRMTAADIRYYEVDEARDAKIQKGNFEYKTFAALLLIQSSMEEVFKVAYQVNKKPAYGVMIDLNKGEDYIRTSLQPVVENFSADFIRMHGDVRNNLRLMVDAAIEETIIVFNEHEDSREWGWQRATGSKGPKKICKVEKGNKPVEALIDFLMTVDGGNHLAELKQRESEYYDAVTL